MNSFLIGLAVGSIITGTMVYLYHKGKLAPLIERLNTYEAKLGIPMTPKS